MRFGLTAVAVAFSMLATAAMTAAMAAPVQVVPLGGPDRWDYLTADAASHRVYVAHGTEVTVVDGETGTVIGRVSGLGVTHGIALSPHGPRAFVANDKQVTAFDRWSLGAGASTPTGDGADAAFYDPASRRVLVMNGGSHTVTAVDRSGGRVAGTLTLGGKPEFAAGDGRGTVYVNIEDTRELVRLDARRLTITARWPIAACEDPHGLAMDRRQGLLFVGCVNSVMLAVRAADGQVIATLPIGKGSDAVAFDSRRRVVYSSNGEGTLSRFREAGPGRFLPLPTLPTAVGARTMAVDPATGKVFLITADIDPDKPQTPRRAFKPGTVKMLILTPDDNR